MRHLTWGILSAGRICEQFVQDLPVVTNSRIGAIAARNIDDAKSFARKHNIDKAYGNYQALFDDPNIDIVYIGTPHYFSYRALQSCDNGRQTCAM